MQKLLIAAVILFATSLSAQSIKVRGVIQDTLSEPLEFANVIATIEASGDIESYGITNEDGLYQLDLPKGETYTLRASFLGFETVTKSLTVPEDAENMKIDFVLKSISTELDGVEIVYEMPVVVRGDTVVYNADSFNTGTERKLEDVLENLPGVEINEDGQVEVEGKVVNKLMVNGKDFFDGDTKLATKNIPSNAVDKVQVLRNYSEVGQLSGVRNNQDNVALNITLREGKENFWFGNITAGGGLTPDNELYLLQPKLSNYNPKYNINFIVYVITN